LSEDGVEENNTIQYNLAAHIHVLGAPQNPSLGLNGDDFYGQTLSFYPATSSLLIPSDIAAGCFYVTNMYNTLVGNAASGGWTGFSFPSLPLPIQDFNTVTNMCPANRPFQTPFRGNSAHSSGFWWGSGAAFYFGGELTYTDSTLTTLTYTAGRTYYYYHQHHQTLESDVLFLFFPSFLVCLWFTILALMKPPALLRGLVAAGLFLTCFGLSFRITRLSSQTEASYQQTIEMKK
jgi:hypothetical protein